MGATGGSTGVHTYDDALARIGRALKFGIHPSLAPVQEVCRLLGDPQRRYRVVQVAGTNGKTSVARMCSAVLTAHGLVAGHYLSPHLEDYTERLVVDGEEIGPDRFAGVLEAIVPAAETVEARRGQPLTEFELLTAMAFQHFADVGCDVAVLEVGLGGRWDATTVADPDVAVVVTIGLDHTDRLGDTEALIASEKAAIVKPGGRLVLGRVGGDAKRVFAERIAATRVPVRRLGLDFTVQDSEAPRGMLGALIRTAGGRELDVWLATRAPYQRVNAAVAVAAAEWTLELCGGRLDPAATTNALGLLAFPGRMELLSCDDPTLVIDGAHNPEAASALALALREALAGRRLVLVVGIMADKDARGILEPLVPLADAVVCTRNRSLRAEEPERLAAIAREVASASGTNIPVEAVLSVEAACRRAIEVASEDGVVVVTGSLYTAGEARAWWRSVA